MLDKKTLNSLTSFTESENTTPNFILIYIIMWFVWHNQLFSEFFSAEGDFLTRLSTAFSTMGDNQYFLVFCLSSFIYILFFTFNYLRFKSKEALDSPDHTFQNLKADQRSAKSSDISHLMDLLEKTKQQLAEARAKEKQAVADKSEMTKRLLKIQCELDEAKADIDVLTKAQMNKVAN